MIGLWIAVYVLLVVVLAAIVRFWRIVERVRKTQRGDSLCALQEYVELRDRIKKLETTCASIIANVNLIGDLKTNAMRKPKCKCAKGKK